MSDSKATATPLFNNKTYDTLKYVALVVLPGLGALYFGLGQIWGFPKSEEVVGTITVIDTFLGLLLRESNKTYQNSDARFDGHIDVVHDAQHQTVSLNVDGDPAEVFEENDELTLKVNSDEKPVEVVEVVEEPKPRKRSPRKKLT